MMPVVAQHGLPRETTITHQGAVRPCLVSELDFKPAHLLEAWEDYMDDTWDADTDTEDFMHDDDLVIARKVNIDRITSKTMDLYAAAAREDQVTRFYVFGALGYDIYVDPVASPVEFAGMKAVMTKFLNQALPGLMDMQTKAMRKKLDDLGDDRDDLRDDIEDKEKDMAKLRESIDADRKKLQGVEADYRTMESAIKTSERQNAKLLELIGTRVE